jgi:chromatin segregation and condensation protein Rec8/ScpA/Scc1 (kleisin family)
MTKPPYRLDRDCLLDSAGILNISPSMVKSNRLKAAANGIAAMRKAFSDSGQIRVKANQSNAENADYKLARTLSEKSAFEMREKFLEMLEQEENHLVVLASIAKESSDHTYIPLGALQSLSKDGSVSFVGDEP